MLGKDYKIKKGFNPFAKRFTLNTQSKLKIAEPKRPLTSAVNHTRDKYDTITRSRKNTSSRTTMGYTKSQTISAFAHVGRVYAPNYSQEYQKAARAGSAAFNRSKGMCSEMLNGAHHHNFIATTFGTRS